MDKEKEIDKFLDKEIESVRQYITKVVENPELYGWKPVEWKGLRKPKKEDR